MAHPCSRHSLILLSFLFLVYQHGYAFNSFNESCHTGDSPCESIIAYSASTNMTLADIASLFSVDSDKVVEANNYDIKAENVGGTLAYTGDVIRVPVSCSCVNHVRKGNSTTYTVQDGDYLSKIATYYDDLITYQEIADTNNITDVDKIFPGQNFIIPYPCACHSHTFKGKPAFYATYKIKENDTVSGIAKEYGITTSDLTGLNSNSTNIGDVMQIPITACSSSSFNMSSSDYGLIVARKSYTLTADDCVQCSCSSNGEEVFCSAAYVSTSCGSLKCANSNLTVGESSKRKSSGSCKVKSCVYKGYQGSTIYSSLNTTTEKSCPASPPPPQYSHGTIEAPAPSSAPAPNSGAPVTSEAPNPPANPGTSAPPPASCGHQSSLAASALGVLVLSCFL